MLFLPEILLTSINFNQGTPNYHYCAFTLVETDLFTNMHTLVSHAPYIILL